MGLNCARCYNCSLQKPIYRFTTALLKSPNSPKQNTLCIIIYTFNFEIILLVRTQNFPKHLHFLSPDTHTYVCVSALRNISFSASFAYALNECSLFTSCISGLFQSVLSQDLLSSFPKSRFELSITTLLQELWMFWIKST